MLPEELSCGQLFLPLIVAFKIFVFDHVSFIHRKTAFLILILNEEFQNPEIQLSNTIAIMAIGAEHVAVILGAFLSGAQRLPQPLTQL